MLEWYEAYADYRDTMDAHGAARRARRRGDARHDAASPSAATRSTSRRWQRVKLVDALAEHGLWTRDEAELRARLNERDVDTHARQHLGAARRPRALALRRAGADPADDPARLPGRALAVRTRDRRGPGDRRALRVLRRRHGARQRLHRDQRLRGAGGSASRCRRPRAPAATSRPSRATRTTSRRSRTACRRPAASGWASTGSRWCSAGRSRSAT